MHFLACSPSFFRHTPQKTSICSSRFIFKRACASAGRWACESQD
jgi:hypothetical protein